MHTRCQIGGTDTEDTINAIEAACRTSDADALLGDGQPRTEGDRVGVLGSC